MAVGAHLLALDLGRQRGEVTISSPLGHLGHSLLAVNTGATASAQRVDHTQNGGEGKIETRVATMHLSGIERELRTSGITRVSCLCHI